MEKKSFDNPCLQKFEVPETIEQRILEAAVPGEAIRFAVTAYTLGNADREAKSYDSSMVNVGDNSGGIANEVSILWHANFEEFIRHLRHKVFLLLLFSFMGQITTSVAEPVSQEASTDDEIFIYQSLIFDDGLKCRVPLLKTLKDYAIKALVNIVDHLDYWRHQLGFVDLRC
ncbi:hypothetical protein AHAS_Ahas18G0223000 [Arachis hypogaea]